MTSTEPDNETPREKELSSPTSLLGPSSSLQPPSIAQFLAFLRLKIILQRLPGVFTISFLLLCFFGPVFTPGLYAVYFVWIHIYFLWSTLRSFISSYWTFRECVAHTHTDWRVKFDQVMADKEEDVGIRLKDVIHVVIIPQYKEELDTMKETLGVLASHAMAKTNYMICLAMEQGEPEAPEKASILIGIFKDEFKEIFFTLHPRGIAGEIRGKSSNTAWAAKEILSLTNEYPCVRANQVLTVMDADTCFAADYFEAVSFYYASSSEKERGLLFFSTPTLFDRNADKVPFLVRAYDMQWSMGVISNYYPFSIKQAPCSAYSLSADLAHGVGLWDVDAGAIGEDLHMFLKCFFSTQGQLKVQPVYSPASQCNIEGKGYWGGIRARYIQSKRHMWAALDVQYSIRRSLFALLAPGFDAPLKESRAIPIKLSPLSSYNMFSLLYRTWSVVYTVFESHFFVTQTLVLIATSSVLIPPGIIPGIAPAYWTALSPSTPLDTILSSLNGASNYLRIAATVFYVAGVYYYENYQAWCGIYRWQEEHARVKLGIRSRLQFRRPWYSVLDWFSFPVTGVLYLVLPQLQVHISQLFTENLDYVVAAKPSVQATAAPTPLPSVPFTKEASEPAVVVVVAGEPAVVVVV